MDRKRKGEAINIFKKRLPLDALLSLCCSKFVYRIIISFSAGKLFFWNGWENKCFGMPLFILILIKLPCCCAFENKGHKAEVAYRFI